jgi:hypothetical protein
MYKYKMNKFKILYFGKNIKYAILKASFIIHYAVNLSLKIFLGVEIGNLNFS